MKQQMYIDCRIGSYGTDAVRMIALYDTQNDQLIISKLLPYQPPKDPYKGKTAAQIAQMKEIERNTVVAVDNSMSFPKWDLHFVETENLDEAVQAYYLLDRTKCLVLGDEVKQQCNPENIIQVRAMDIAGKKYELNSDDLTNGTMGVLMVCWAAIRMRNASVMIEEGSDPTQQDIDNFDVPFTI